MKTIRLGALKRAFQRMDLKKLAEGADTHVEVALELKMHLGALFTLESLRRAHTGLLFRRTGATTAAALADSAGRQSTLRR